MLVVEAILFWLAFGAGVGVFVYRVGLIVRVIRMGRPFDTGNSLASCLRNLFVYAILQVKMFKLTVAAVFHFLVFLGFFVVNLEMIEVFAEALTLTHRPLKGVLPAGAYQLFVNIYEAFTILVLLSCLIFLLRRYVVKVERFRSPEIAAKSRLDAVIILVGVSFLMLFVLLMNTADTALGMIGGGFVSARMTQLFTAEHHTLYVLSRVGWWGHNLLMFALLAYLPGSKHLHMFFSFVNVALTPKTARGALLPMPQVEAILTEYMGGGGAASAGEEELGTFGAKDITDLPWKSLLDAFTCTECGRCTACCPANLTGKKLSPRKVVMDVRKRAETIIRHCRKNGWESLPAGCLLDYVSEEEILACTVCGACVEACPVNINPLLIILEMRRHLTMEVGKPPRQWALMFSNLENNGAPWQFNPNHRGKWAESIRL